MFSIYNYGDRIFNNTMEQLYKVNPTGNASRSLEVRSDMFDSSTLKKEEYKPNANAINAYRELVNINPKEQIHHVYEIMQKDYVALNDKSSLYDGIKLLFEEPTTGVMVVSESEHIVGFFSLDSASEMILNSKNDPIELKMKPLKDYISERVITVDPVTSIRRAAEVMKTYNLSLLPVVDSYERVIGVITNQALAGAVANDPPMSVWT